MFLSLLMVWQLFAYDLPVYADSIAQALDRVAAYRQQELEDARLLVAGEDDLAAETDGANATGVACTLKQASQSGSGAPLASGSDVTLAAQGEDGNGQQPKIVRGGVSADDDADDSQTSESDAQVSKKTSDASSDDGQAADGSADGQASDDAKAGGQSGENAKAGGQTSEGSGNNGTDTATNQETNNDKTGDSAEGDPTDADLTDGDAADGDAGDDGDAQDAERREWVEPDILRDGYIHIATYEQLRAVGSDDPVSTTDRDERQFGTGEVVEDAGGNAVTYALGAAYYLDVDIALPSVEGWQLPDSFAGSFNGPEDAEGTLAARIYDPTTDTIYIQNPWQLDILASAERAEMPVMTGDVAAKTFGAGKLIFPDGSQADPEETGGDAEAEAELEGLGETGVESEVGSGTDAESEASGYLTYDETHNYALSMTFTSKRGKLKALKASGLLRDGEMSTDPNADHVDGRDYFGQVTKEIGGTTYILIGDRQQLDAINSDKTTRTKVCGPVFKITEGTVHKKVLGAAGNWVFLSEFKDADQLDDYRIGSNKINGGNGYGTTEEEVLQAKKDLIANAEIIYPGDADLVDDIITTATAVVSFGNSPLYDTTGSTYPSLGGDNTTTATSSTDKRNLYFTLDDGGIRDVTKTSSSDLYAKDGATTLTYTKDGNYIVFRDIDMTKGDADQVDYGTLANGDWKPLMFTGNMYGVKAQSSSDQGTIAAAMQTLTSGGSLDANTRRPTISNTKVTPITTEQSGKTRLMLDRQVGVGFFGTISGRNDNSVVANVPGVVKNIALKQETVDNPAVKGEVDMTVINGLLTGLGLVLDAVLGDLLTALLGKTVSVNLETLLNARAKDPTSLATGAFAGRIIGNATVADCAVEDVSVSTRLTDFESGAADGKNSQKIVGKGGFVGHVEGETQYDLLTGLAGSVVTGLAALLNIIPGLGLGDLVTVLLDNALPLDQLIPTGYTNPVISKCEVVNASLSTDEDGKVGVGGFAGSVCGSVLNDCVVRDSELTVKADHFGGGFVGIERDAIIKGTLSGLGVDVGLHPQSETIRCSISNCNLQVTGDSYLGGFAGAMANSYGINSTVSGEDGSTTVSGTGDYVGGYAGYAHLGTAMGLGSYLVEDESLLGTVKGLVTGLLGQGKDQSLLDLGGVAPSAIMGLQMDVPLAVSSTGSYVGGVVGRGNGVYITSSSPSNMRKLGKYDNKKDDVYVTALPIAASEARDNTVSNLISVSAGDESNPANFAGGIAGYLTSANIGGLLGDTAGIGQYLGFTLSDTTIEGVDAGYTVEASDSYAGGGIGWAVGGDVVDANLYQLGSVTANRYAGGFVGATGPGDLVSGGGLDLTLLGVNLLSVDNLLSLAAGVRTTYERANVTGIDSGFTVEATGQRSGSDTADYVAGGWAAEANSVRVVDSQVANLLSVTANMAEGKAGGYVGDSSAGGLAGVAKDETGALKLLSLNNLLNAVPYLIPSYDGCSTTYVDGGFVQADTAGGFAGAFRSGKINTYVNKIENGFVVPYNWNPISDQLYALDHADGYSCGMLYNEPWSVYNLDHVRGGAYAGGWGGKVYSGALASAGEGLSLLGGDGIDITGLVNVASAYVPIIYCAGVQGSSTGYQVFAAHEDIADQPATAGKAGGYIGYGSGVQVSYSDVKYLRSGQPTEPTALTSADSKAYSRIGIAPDALESEDGSSYMDFGSVEDDLSNVPYAVAGVTHAGGYIGHMDVGSAASVGDKLKLLDVLNLQNVLSALSAVVSTIEHSDVVETPGGYSVVASSHVNLGDSAFDDKGMGYAGGYVGQMTGSHIQDGNSYNFYYVIGEVAAGGYAGEIKPGSVADVLGDDAGANLAKLDVLDTSGLLSLAQDFVPTIRNSETTCVPCGGAVRAEKLSDGTGAQGAASQLRGMAGGYVGHSKGGQIWGYDHRRWKDVDDYPFGTVPANTAGPRECAAIRIRSVYGAEYAGGFCGLMECASTAESGGLSLLGDLIQLNNLLGALQAVYPTIEAGAVYGPLYGMKDFSEATWNAWRSYIAARGGFASQLAGMTYQQMQDTDWSKYVYGTNVVAGRHEYDPHANTTLSGCAGGFVGSMHGGAISGAEIVDELELDYPCHAEDTKLVLAMRAAGGFAGEMQTKGLVEAGGVSILGIDINLGSLLDLAQVFVPAVSTSGTRGYQKGLRVGATGQNYVSSDNDTAAYSKAVGCAGGYVGACYGGQIGISDSTGDRIIQLLNNKTMSGAWIEKLKEVKGTRDIGGFVGRTSSASVVSADTEAASNGFVQKLLNTVASTPNDLLNVLQATIATIKYAKVTAADSEWGIVVDGSYNDASGNTAYAETAGGFAGSLEAAVIGEHDNPLDVITIDGLRGVLGGLYAGGFFGLADVGSVADVGGSGGTSLLGGLVNAGNIGVLDAFRTYIYRAQVTGVSDGLRVYAMDEPTSHGTMNSYRESGAAGGFGGELLNGTVEHSWVKKLNYVEAPNYAAGFIGHTGKNGGVTAEEASLGGNDSVLSLVLGALGLNLGAAAQLFDIVGSTVTDCKVYGFGDGFITKAHHAQTPANTGQTYDNIKGSCSAGFVGFADAAQIEDCHAYLYKEAAGAQIAAGFVGRTSVAYLADVNVDLTLVRGLLSLLNTIGIIPLLYGVTNAVPPIKIGDVEFKLLSEGSVLYFDLFGFKVGASLVKAEEGSGKPDALTIVLGSSTITVPYSRDTNDVVLTESDASIQLIEGNRTSIKNCSVKGITDGYDVYGGGTSQKTNSDGATVDVYGTLEQPIAPVEPTAPALEEGETAESDTYKERVAAYEAARVEYEEALAEYNAQKAAFDSALASYTASNPLGYAGGFVGYNDNGFLSNDDMVLCDVVLGTSDRVGPFVGCTESSDSNNGSRPQAYLEGTNNRYRIYRTYEPAYVNAVTSGGTKFNEAFVRVDANGGIEGERVWNCYRVQHLDVIDQHADLKDATATGGGDPIVLGAYASAAKAVLMDDTPATPNGKGDTVEPDELKDPCDQTFDLTVNKKWDDLFNLLGARPDGITVYVWQVDAGTNLPDELVTAGVPDPGYGSATTLTHTLTLDSTANAQQHTEAWKARLEDLPVAYMATVPVLDSEGQPVPKTDEDGNPVYVTDDDGNPIPVLDDEGNPVLGDDGNPTYQLEYQTAEELHYWRYYVCEGQINDYVATYETVQDTASVTVTNTYKEGMLPFLGGDGGARLICVAYLLAAVVSACIVYRMRRKREGVVD